MCQYCGNSAGRIGLSADEPRIGLQGRPVERVADNLQMGGMDKLAFVLGRQLRQEALLQQ